MTNCIDAHFHLWQYSPAQYGWIDDSMESLRRDFLPADMPPEMNSAGVRAGAAVQARRTMEKTRWLLALARDSACIAGVVGWEP